MLPRFSHFENTRLFKNNKEIFIMKAYLIQEFSNLDQTWHSVNFASSLIVWRAETFDLNRGRSTPFSFL